MFLRVSLFTTLLSVTVSGAFMQSASADWYGIEIRSQEQAAMEFAERQSSQLNLPRNVWYDGIHQSGESKPNQSGKAKPETTISQESVSEVVVDNVWQASVKSTAKSATGKSATKSAAVEVEATTVSKQRTLVSSTTNVSDTPVIDKAVANDVDHLLNQKEDWFAPIAGAEEASRNLENIAFEESVNVAESMTYLDELRELEGKESQWIQSSVVVADRNLNVKFGTTQELMKTQPMFVNELEMMAARHEGKDVGAQIYSHLAELESLRSRNSMMVSSTNQFLAQADSPDAYSPKAAAAKADQIDQMESLFPSITKISINGTSTDPRGTKVEFPKNLAAAHMENLIPGEYVMGPVVGVSAPSRYPVCFQHNPLYFEDPNLERCGVSQGCLTTTYSAVKFLGNAIALPYLVIATPPKTCMASLGDCPTCASFDTDAYYREWKWNR